MKIKEMVMPEVSNTGEATASLINRTNDGSIDTGGLSKEAAIYIRHGNIPKPKPRHSQIHLIIMSDYNVYGPNINGDAYVGSHRNHKFEDGKSITFKSNGIEDMINSSLEHGGCYSEHNNSKKKDVRGNAFESVGDIVWANYNKPRERGEVVIEVQTDKWNNTINDISGGKPVYFSHGTTVPFDICSICGKKSKSLKDRCEHVAKGGLLSYTDKGNQVFTISPEGTMHDVSRVLTPADSMGHGLEKVAGSMTKMLQKYNPRRTLTFSKISDLEDSTNARSAEKLAEMEKYLISQASGFVDSGITDKEASAMAVMSDSDLVSMMVNTKSIITPDIMASIARKQGSGIIPQEFAGICSNGLFSMLEQAGETDGVTDSIRGSFSRGVPMDISSLISGSCKLGERGGISRAIRRVGCGSKLNGIGNDEVGMYIQEMKRYANLIVNAMSKMPEDTQGSVINIYL